MPSFLSFHISQNPSEEQQESQPELLLILNEITESASRLVQLLNNSISGGKKVAAGGEEEKQTSAAVSENSGESSSPNAADDNAPFPVSGFPSPSTPTTDEKIIETPPISQPEIQKTVGKSDSESPLRHSSACLLKIHKVAEGVQGISENMKELSEGVRVLHPQDPSSSPFSHEESRDVELELKTVENFQKKAALYTDGLMKSLMELDSIVGSESARPKRKEQVNRIQNLLQDADNINSKLRQLHSTLKKEADSRAAALAAKQREQELQKQLDLQLKQQQLLLQQQKKQEEELQQLKQMQMQMQQNKPHQQQSHNVAQPGKKVVVKRSQSGNEPPSSSSSSSDDEASTDIYNQLRRLLTGNVAKESKDLTNPSSSSSAPSKRRRLAKNLRGGDSNEFGDNDNEEEEEEDINDQIPHYLLPLSKRGKVKSGLRTRQPPEGISIADDNDEEEDEEESESSLNSGELRKMWKRLRLQPQIDIDQNAKCYFIHGVIPGMKEDDIDIKIDQSRRVLTIEGFREPTSRELEIMRRQLRSSQSRRDLRHFYPTREPEELRLLRLGAGRYGTFSQNFSVPKDADLESISARYEDDQLFVVIPKTSVRNLRPIGTTGLSQTPRSIPKQNLLADNFWF